MKNTNLKLNKTKLVARLMLVVVLVSIVSLASCHHGDDCIWYEVSGNFDSFEDTQAFIQERIDKYGYNIIAFDLDNEPFVANTNYHVLLESRSSYHPYISATFHLLKNEMKIAIDYLFLSFGSNFDDDVKFEIQLIEIKDYYDLSEDAIYQKSLIYNLYYNSQNIAEIEFSVPSLEDGNYEEYYSDVCDMLLENLVVIK